MEGEQPDEQRHREADPAKKSRAGDLTPARLGWKLRQSKLDQQCDNTEHTHQFANDKTAGNTHRQRLAEHREAQPGERDASIGEAKDRHDDECNGLVERMLQAMKR